MRESGNGQPAEDPPKADEGWRRERDSNPRSPFGTYAISSRAPSTTRPSLRGHDSIVDFQQPFTRRSPAHAEQRGATTLPQTGGSEATDWFGVGHLSKSYWSALHQTQKSTSVNCTFPVIFASGFGNFACMACRHPLRIRSVLSHYPYSL